MTSPAYATVTQQEGLGAARCPLCLSDETRYWTRARDVEYYTTEEWFNYFRCDSCDVIFLHPLPLTRLREIYPFNYYSYVSGKPAYIKRFKNLLDRRRLRSVLNDIPGHTLSVLDIGGGTGETLSLVRLVEERVKTTHVIDLDERSEEVARAAGHGYSRCRIEDFSPAGEYDLILMLNLIEHVENPVAVLRKARTLLAPEGRMLVKTPNTDSLDARLFRHRSWGGYHCPRHWTLFTPASFFSAAAAAGLSVRRISYTQGAPFWAISIFNMLREAGWVKSSADAPAPFHPLIRALQAIFAVVDFARAPFSRTSQVFVELALGPNPAGSASSFNGPRS
jgi:SAM-dependent methyltransferase